MADLSSSSWFLNLNLKRKTCGFTVACKNVKLNKIFAYFDGFINRLAMHGDWKNKSKKKYFPLRALGLYFLSLTKFKINKYIINRMYSFIFV